MINFQYWMVSKCGMSNHCSTLSVKSTKCY
ncbi:hypothetical protein [Salmonella phage SD-1_S14]|nr:hypothetical protein [Salmonella phage SD-2_S15]WPK18990.1 hypothetical protein [Salmonella phage SD-6_S16]WPK19662.1 hypothetical protein [Salmonella phage SD-1_S14]WPK20684.1 hypothetical protein [Salmonella phage SD-15_S21]